jgi:hypothetical protein
MSISRRKRGPAVVVEFFGVQLPERCRPVLLRSVEAEKNREVSINDMPRATACCSQQRQPNASLSEYIYQRDSFLAVIKHTTVCPDPCQMIG